MNRSWESSDRSVFAQYEAGFLVVMATLAFLCRDNTALEWPQVPFLFLLLMALNLAAGVVLRLWGNRALPSACFIVANCAVIAAIVARSGGAESNLWVLYVLPISSAAMLLGPRDLAWISAGAVLFNAVNSWFDAPAWGVEQTFELALKSGLFFLSAALTWRLVDRDRLAGRKLAEQRAELESLSRRLAPSPHDSGLVASGLAHDLKNTLMVSSGWAELVLEHSSLSTEARADVRRFLNSTRLGQGLAAQLLALNGASAPSPDGLCDVHDALALALSTLEGCLARRSVRVETRYDRSLPDLAAPPLELERLFFNLLSNAVQAMPNGGRISIATDWVLTVASTEALVVIEDSGPGLPEEVLARLFTPFTTTRTSEGGHGLGLFVCSEIAQRCGGRLQAENGAGGGARFSLLLPIPRRTLGGRRCCPTKEPSQASNR